MGKEIEAKRRKKIKMTFNKSSQRISFLSLVKNCNHKRLGIYYLLSAFIFGISGTLISVLIRIELYSTGNRIISPENQNFYNVSITLHGLIMIYYSSRDYVVAHFHFVLSLGAVIAIFSGIIFVAEKIVGSKILLPSPSSTLSLYHLVLTLVGILLTFSPMHFLGFNVMPRRIPDFPDSFHSRNFLSSIGSGI